jgi:hypothetical protein
MCFTKKKICSKFIQTSLASVNKWFIVGAVFSAAILLVLILVRNELKIFEILSFVPFFPLKNEWDNTPLFVKYNPGLLDLLVLLDETGLQTVL